MGKGIINYDAAETNELLAYVKEIKEGGGINPDAPKDGNLYGQKNGEWTKAQEQLESGKNIKTLNGVPVLGEGNIDVAPTIGENGNWFINGKDTGKPAKGKDGADGVSLGEIALVQETGTESGSEKKVMSQAAVTKELTGLDNKSSYQSVSMVMNTGGSGAAYIGETLKKDWGDDVLLTINQWNISNKDIRFSYHVDGNEEQKIKILSIDGPGNYIVNFEGKPTDIRPYVLASEIEMEGEVNITLYDRLGTMQYINSLDIVNNTNEINTLKEDVSLTNTIINGGEIIVSSITGKDLINDSAYWGLNFDIGYKLSDTPQSIENYSGYVAEVKSGQIIKLKSINNTNIIPWAITDNERLIVAKNDSFGTGSLESYTINVEKDGYIYTNQNTATKSSFSLIIEEESTDGLNKKVSDNSKSIDELDNKSSYQSVSMVMNTGGSGAAYIGETLKKDWGDDVLLTINQWNISNKDIRFSYHVDGNEEQKIKILSIDGPGNYIVNFEGKPTDIRPYVLASEIEMEGEVNITLYDRLGTMQYINSLDIVNNTNEINTLKEDVSLTNTIINGGEIIVSSITGKDLINDSAYWGLNFDIGYKLSDTPQSIENYSGYVAEVKSGQIIKLKSINNTNIIPWAITDNERLIVAKNDSFGTGSLESYTINVEKDGYIYTNQNTATKSSFSLIIEEESTDGLNKKVSDNSKSIDELNKIINTGSEEEIVKNVTSAELTNDSSYYALNIEIGSKAPEVPLEISNYSGYVTDVKAGQVIELSSTNNTNITPWALTDNNKIVRQISDVKGTGSLENYSLVVENDGYIYTNQNTATKETFSLVIKQSSQKGLIEEVAGLKAGNILLTNRVSKNEQDIADLKKSQGGSSTVRIGFMNLQNEEITDGKRVELEYNNIRKNYSICGYINFTKFEKVRFGKDTSEQGFIIEVDNTNVKLTRSRNGTDDTLYPHGLTISTFLGFDIRNVGGYSQLFLYSDSGRYKLEKEIMNPGYDSAFFESVGTTGTLLSFSQVNIDYNKDIWLIQDSYGGWVNWGWAYNLYKIGYDTFLLDSHGGAGSLSQLTVLKTHLKYATPKYLVWAMGMNDKDTGDIYNANWKLALDEVIQICNEKGIELILCTIPNAVKEGYINTYKNRYVRTLSEEQSYKLIDFADAVQLSFESSEWKPGLLSDDELHPNEKGGQVLSIRAATDFPQLLNGKTISS